MALFDRKPRGREILERSNAPREETAIVGQTLDATERGQTTYYELKTRIHGQLIERLDLAKLDALPRELVQQQIRRIVEDMLALDETPLSRKERDDLVIEIEHETFGLGPIEPLMQDPTVSDILVNGAQEVYVERRGKLERTRVTFRDDTHLLQVIDRIVSAVGRRVDESSPMVDARLPDGSRVNAIIRPLALDGPVLSIRRFAKDPLRMADMIEFGTLTPALAEILRATVQARLNILVSGGTGAGKTTMLNVLSNAIPNTERIVTIEDSAELQLQQPHVISLEARPPNVEGKGQVTIRDLVRNSLRMRPDRIVVGEVRGPETIDMLQAMNTGHDGSLTTVHANSAEDSIVRMQTLASMSEVDVPFLSLRDQINSAIDVIVQIERGADGRRRLVEVAAVSSRLREEFRLATIMRFEPDPIGPDRLVTGTWVHYPLPDTVAERLRIRAEPTPAVYTEDAADELEAPERSLERQDAERLSQTAGPDAPRR
jgi:pilus assembly protein CpaF